MLENISHPHCPYWELYSMFMSCGLIEKHCKRAQACTWSRHTSLLLDNKFCLLWSPNVNRCTCQHSDWSQLPPLHLPNVVSYQCNSSLGSQAIQSPLQVVLWHPFNLFLKFYRFFSPRHMGAAILKSCHIAAIRWLQIVAPPSPSPTRCIRFFVEFYRNFTAKLYLTRW